MPNGTIRSKWPALNGFLKHDRMGYTHYSGVLKRSPQLKPVKTPMTVPETFGGPGLSPFLPFIIDLTGHLSFCHARPVFL
jgi:hypothetical protein